MLVDVCLCMCVCINDTLGRVRINMDARSRCRTLRIRVHILGAREQHVEDVDDDKDDIHDVEPKSQHCASSHTVCVCLCVGVSCVTCAHMQASSMHAMLSLSYMDI